MNQSDIPEGGGVPQSLRNVEVPKTVESAEEKSVRSRQILICILALLVVTATSASIYLGYLASRWADFGDKTHAANYELGAQIAQTRADLADAKESLAITRSQLTTAQERISELAKEKALVGDDRELQRIQAQDTAALAKESLVVSRELGRCVQLQDDYAKQLTVATDAQTKLFNAQNTDAPETSQLESLRNRVIEEQESLTEIKKAKNSLCETASVRHKKLLKDLQE